MADVRIAVRPARVALVLSLIAAALAIAHGLTVVLDRAIGHDAFPGSNVLVRLFSMDGETNVPAWYSASALLGCGALALLISCTQPPDRSRERWLWLFLAAVLTFLSIDEAAVIHEELSRPLTRQLDLDPDAWRYWAWVGPYTALALVVAAISWRLLRGLDVVTRRLVVVAGVLYVAGAAGLELVGSRLFDEDEGNIAYSIVVGVEELMEMAGVIVLAYALLRHLRDRVGPVELVWVEDA